MTCTLMCTPTHTNTYIRLLQGLRMQREGEIYGNIEDSLRQRQAQIRAAEDVKATVCVYVCACQTSNCVCACGKAVITAFLAT